MRRRMIVLVLATALPGAWGALGHGPRAGAVAHLTPLRSVTRASGQTRATLVYRRLQDLGGGDDYFTDARIVIARGGKEAFHERIPLHPRLAPGTPVHGETRTLVVRDLDGDHEPEVRVELDSGGAHCCAWTRAYRYDAANRGYVPVTHFWGNTSSRPTIADVDDDGRPEFISTDDRFAYDFNGYAGSVRPIQIWSYARGRFRDVTRLHPQLVRQDAARLWRFYVKDRRDLPGSARGLLPAWAADLYLVGKGAKADRELVNAGRHGYLVRAVDGPRDPSAYVAAVKRLLRRTGYIHARGVGRRHGRTLHFCRSSVTDTSQFSR
jgi:hypothetical protein